MFPQNSNKLDGRWKNRKEVLMWHSRAPRTFDHTGRFSYTNSSSEFLTFSRHQLHQKIDRILNLPA